MFNLSVFCFRSGFETMYDWFFTTWNILKVHNFIWALWIKRVIRISLLLEIDGCGFDTYAKDILNIPFPQNATFFSTTWHQMRNQYKFKQSIFSHRTLPSTCLWPLFKTSCPQLLAILLYHLLNIILRENHTYCKATRVVVCFLNSNFNFM